MQGKHEYQPELFSQIDYERLIPAAHLLRRIDRVLDLSFLPVLTKPLYSEVVGRPSIDPVVFVRMVLLGYLYNIDSDRQLCEEVGYNLAYRWFCRLSLKDSVPDHSSLTRIRDRLGEKTYKVIFLNIVDQCRRAGLVKGERVMADGSIIKANASIYNMEWREGAHDEPPSTDSEYTDTTHSKDGLSSNDMRRGDIRGKKISNETHVSKSDPDSTLAGKAHEYKALAFKTHHIIDADSRVVMDCHVTTGAVSEVKVLCDRVDAVKRDLGITIEEMIADRGYGSAENLQALSKKGVDTNIPLWSTRSGQSLFKDLELGFEIDHVEKSVRCPAGREMKRRGRDNTHQRYRFEMRGNVCGQCPLADRCLTDIERKNKKKTFYVSDFHHALVETYEKQKNPEFREKLQERMWKMEGIFAEGKSHHGLRRARYRGRWKVQVQVYMISTVQNLKRLAGAFFFFLSALLGDLIKAAALPRKIQKSAATA